ncbi:[SSU ribosomal protein S18P]-alanine acetyltransferase [Desulfurobacterium pacificum]|uniref:[Ribosomal protein bS18]-alanine N-acetyltransferase n=1 Tax=Desulfurobacterium pacificum TaxID=240166 RepID=A0ABY1NP95_9BACT|nr:ribosomal protein S18-alanine N-acetyltransferase [Desulfurobacterium pacificum]SMP14028.1 [SSU ribosomal protein S18P]-alanine acetyltransferase [Desulfurobacterium pacificum]
MQNLKILPLTQLDEKTLKEVAAIEKASFKDSYSLESLKRELSLSFSHIFVAKENEKTAGYCILWIIGNEAEIHKIAVAPEQRRKGIGKQLLKAVLRTLKEKNVKRVFLEVNEKNMPAINLYKSCGFKVIGRRENYYGKGESALLMETLL